MKTLFTTFWIVAANAAFAATPASIDSIDEVSVTAKRRPASLSEISSAVSVVDRKAVQAEKLVTDALAATVGVFLQQTTPGQGAAIVRGLKGSAILHLVDGMRLNNAIFRSAPTQYLALVPPTAIERVEIIRGTPTSLFGSDAVGGVVQVVSRVPKFHTSEIDHRGEILLAVDSADLGKTLRATLDAGNRDLVASFGAGYQVTGNRRTGGGERLGPSGYESRSARLLLVASPADAAAWLVDLQYLEQPKTPRIDELVPGFGQIDPSSSEFFFAPNQRRFAHVQRHSAAGLLDLDWDLDLAWQRIVDDRVARDLDAPVRRLEQNRSDLFAVSITASSNGQHGSWILGAEVDYDRVQSTRVEETVADGQRQPVTSRFPNGSTLRQAGLYGSRDFSFGDRHVVSAGLRYSSVDVDLPATAIADAATVSVNDLSGDIGWIFDLNDTMQLTANAGLGFRAPNVFDVGTLGIRPGNRFNIPNTDLESEYVTQVDLGLRYRGDRLQAELVLYALDYDDRITSVLTGDITADGRDVVQSVNAAESSIHGIEAGLEAEINDELSARLILNYTRGEQRLDGNAREPADRIPPLSGQLQLDYEPSDVWHYAAWANFADRQERLSARDTRDVRINPEGSAGWASVGASASRDTGDWILTIEFDNVLDKRYRNHGSGLDAAGRDVSLIIQRRWR